MSLDSLFERAFYEEKLQDKFFYELLLNDVYIIAENEFKDTGVQEGDNLKVFSIDHEEESYVPVFLSKQSLDLFLNGFETNYVKANAADILETFKHRNIVINPGKEESIVLYADEVEGLLQQGMN